MSLGAALRAKRRSLGLTQANVARLAGVKQALVSEIERDAGNPRFSVLDRVGRAVGLYITLEREWPYDGFRPVASTAFTTTANGTLPCL